MQKSFDPKNSDDIQQLSRAVGYSRNVLKVFRTNRLDLIRQYVGTHYSDNGADKKVPINLIELAMNIYLQRLVAQAPAVSINTQVTKLKEICTRFESAGNHLVQEIDLGKSLEMAVTGAMFCKGIIKIGINLSKVEIGGILHDSGQAFADVISLDDWVEDMTVDNEENGQYEGNYYYPTLDEAEAMFPDKIDKLTPRTALSETEDKAHKLSEGSTSTREEFRPTVKLLDLYLKKQNLVLQCLASDDDSNPIQEVLKVIDWQGPERGPYRKLGFGVIENNTMPLAPAMLWRDLHELGNALFRKLGNQAERQKSGTAVQRGGEGDGERVRDFKDGDMFLVDNPKNVNDFKTGGIDQVTLAFFLQVKDLFAYLGGNLDMLGGLGPQSDTLGQDQLLSASASMRIQSMQKKTITFTKGVLEDLLFWMWNDPYTVFPATKSIKGFPEITLNAPLYPIDRENDFMEYNIDIEPYSMQNQTPEAKLQGLRTIFIELISPMIPAMQQQGITMDFESFFRKIAKLGNIPELNDILIYAGQSPENEPFGQPPSKITNELGKAPVTTRRYERRSIPGATNGGKSQIMQNLLTGGNPQPKEMAAIGRTTG